MTTTPDTLAKLAPKLSDKLITLLKCLPEAPFKDHLTAEIEALAAQALPAAEPVKLDVMPIFWKCFRHFPSTAGALTHTVWKDGIDIDKLSAPMQRFCDELVQAAQQAAQATAGLTEDDVFTLIGQSVIDSQDGKVDMPTYFYDLAARIGDAIGRPDLAERARKMAALPQPQPQSAQTKGDVA